MSVLDCLPLPGPVLVRGILECRKGAKPLASWTRPQLAGQAVSRGGGSESDRGNRRPKEGLPEVGVSEGELGKRGVSRAEAGAGRSGGRGQERPEGSEVSVAGMWSAGARGPSGSFSEEQRREGRGLGLGTSWLWCWRGQGPGGRSVGASSGGRGAAWPGRAQWPDCRAGRWRRWRAGRRERGAGRRESRLWPGAAGAGVRPAEMCAGGGSLSPPSGRTGGGLGLGSHVRELCSQADCEAVGLAEVVCSGCGRRRWGGGGAD